MKKSTAVFISIFLFGALSFFILNPLNAQIENWPQFRGINCSGLAAEGQNPPVSFGLDKNILWKASLPEGHSSPCIWGDCIFLTGFEEEGKLLIMYCIDRNDGTIQWEEDIGVEEFEKTHVVSNPATATPATDGERVFFYFGCYGLLCYDYKGEQQWIFPMPVPESWWGMGTSPVVSGDLVILNCFGHFNDPCLLALNKYDGNVVWKHSLQIRDNFNENSYSTPIIHNDQVIIYRSEDVAAYHIKTGERIWRFITTGVMNAVCTPVVGDDILYAAVFSTIGNPELRAQFPGFMEFAAEYDENRDWLLDKKEIEDFKFSIYPEEGEISDPISLASYFERWDQNRDNFIDSTEWRITAEFMASLYEKQGLKAIKLGGYGDVSYDNYLWGHPEHVSHIPSPIYYNNHIYMIRSGGIISCLDAKSGDLLYRERLGAPGAYFSSLIAANGRIYSASRNGIVTVFEAGDKLNILAQNDLDDIIMATPAVVDNKLYIRTAGSLYAFGE
jgi:outer membrane protein assembly factor BamB